MGKKKTPKFNNYTKKRYSQLSQRLDQYLVAVDNLYDALEQDAAQLALASEYTAEKATTGLFAFSISAVIKKAFERVLNTYVANLAVIIDRGTKQEWERAEEDHDDFVTRALEAYKADPNNQEYARYTNHVKDARDAFLKQQATGTHGWSQRVWNLRAQTQQQMELAISASYADGTSAATLATQMKRYLQQPNKLFRRVRNQYGQLVLSRNAAAYHPGAGIYRSSYKNALRLTRTEINMAYRNADIARYQEEDFVVGYEIKLSGRHDEEEASDICDELKGKYPKDFDWTGWHPQCRCYMVPILKTEEEFFSDDEDKPSVNQVDDAPDKFYKYLEQNEARLYAAKQRGTLPYWVKDNFVEDQDGMLVPAFGPAAESELTSGTIVNRAIVEEYTGNAALFNEPARRGETTAKVQELQEEIERHELKKATTLYRGISYDGLAAQLGISDSSDLTGAIFDEDPQAYYNQFVGKTIKDLGFVSTSTGTQHSAMSDVRMTLAAPKGTKALSVNGASRFEGEKEVTLQRGTAYKITGLKFNKNHIELEARIVKRKK